jgi:hypothetical protein
MVTIDKKILELIDFIYDNGYKINFQEFRKLTNTSTYIETPLYLNRLENIEAGLNNIWVFKQDSPEMTFAYLSEIVELINKKNEILFNITYTNELQGYCESKA